MKGNYGQSANGNFKVIDTIGVPHLYCITAQHVTIASDKFCGRLGEDAIQEAEKQGVKCGTRNCRLSFKEHEQALLVECYNELKDQSGKTNPELHAYLLSIKDECELNGYAGFAFVKKELI